MAVLVVETRGGTETARVVCEALAGVVGVTRCLDADLDHRLDRPAFLLLDLVVVACDDHVDAGHRACHALRAVTPSLLVMFTSSTREADELLAFAQGCDDYISTSSSPVVTRARLQGLIARSRWRRTDHTVELGCPATVCSTST